MITGTYYNDPKLLIKIDLGNVRGAEAHLDYDAQTKLQKTNIKLMFVPTREIGRVMMTYRNSILKFNPRSFLELDRNPVNREIEDSIRKKSTNEFALFNNGITITTDNTKISQDTGRRGTAQLVLTNPQLVNGAQTAYTLARIYESCLASDNFSIFRGKEVLVKVITFVGSARSSEAKERAFLVAAISKATNAQTKVDDYDRRSNDPLQMELQLAFYEKFGLFYERKRGEFSDGLRDRYIDRDLLINRENLVRVGLACAFRVNQARAGIGKFATEKELASLLKMSDFAKHAYGYEILSDLEAIRRQPPRPTGDRYKTRKYGQALRYGQYAVVAVCANYARDKAIERKKGVEQVLSQWAIFEAWVSKRRTNKAYQIEESFDFVSYYKGATINSDLQSYKFKFT